MNTKGIYICIYIFQVAMFLKTGVYIYIYIYIYILYIYIYIYIREIGIFYARHVEYDLTKNDPHLKEVKKRIFIRKLTSYSVAIATDSHQT